MFGSWTCIVQVASLVTCITDVFPVYFKTVSIAWLCLVHHQLIMIVYVCFGIILRFAVWGYVHGVKSPSLEVRIGRPTLTNRPHKRFKFRHSLHLSRLAPPSDRYLQSGSLALYQLRPLVPCP